MWKELLYRINETASLLSCFANIVVGTGDREITLSAGSWELKRNNSIRGSMYVFLIDSFWKSLGQENHCMISWYEHESLIQKAKNDRM